MIVAIDGPAGSGKSSTAREVARQLGYLFLDTGAMYRATALWFLRHRLAPDTATAGVFVASARIGIRQQAGEMRVYLDEEDVTADIRSPEVSNMASRVSALPEIREKMVAEQRRVAREHVLEGGGVVLEGRDIGTVVFPEAEIKVFMKADPMVRAQRRRRELLEKGEVVGLDEVLTEMTERDRRDSERNHAPLRQAVDARVIDTSECSFEEQVAKIVALVEERRRYSAV